MADKRNDDYKPLKFYEGGRPEGADATGFYKFSEEGLEYFAYQVDGKVVLISQGYKARAGRDNGIVSTRKNMALEEQYEILKHDNGKWYFNILARNKQQVATSVWFPSKKAATEYAEVLQGKRKAVSTAKPAKAKTAAAKAPRAANVEQNYKPLAFYESRISGVKDGFDTFEDGGQHYFTYNKGGKIALISEGYPNVVARKRGMESVEKNMGLEERYTFGDVGGGFEGYRLKAGNNKEIARSPAYKTAALAAAGAALLHSPGRKRAGNVEQNYKPLAFYEARIQGVDEGFETFVEDGQHYFTYSRDGKILLISEGYPTAAARDKGIASVQTNMGEESQYSYGDVGGGYEGFRLRAKNNKEIARSIAYPSAALAAAGAALLFAPAAAALAEPEPLPEPDPIPEPEPEPIPVAPVAAAAAVAAPVAAAAMAPEPAYDPEPVAVHEEGGGLGWLKWLLLLGLLAALLFGLLSFCNRDAAVPAVPVAAPDPVAVMVTCWDGSEAESDALCPERVECWDGSAVTDASLCPPEPVEEPEPTVVLCADGSTAEDYADCPPVPEPEPEPEPAPATARTSTAVATSGPGQTLNSNLRYADTPGSCACATGSSNIFETNGMQEAVMVTRLGTNPEFGNHQGQSADMFFQTLQNRYGSDTYDRQYLDHLARSLGYGGFGDMDASMFSETTVPNGSRVMLGYGSQHALQYSEFALADSADNSAFRVRSANGCDVNFMKTCGNFAYVCQ